MEASTANASDEPFGDAPGDRLLEQLAKKAAVAEAPVPVLAEGRVVGHRPVQTKSAEPPVGEIEVHLLTQAPLGPDALA